MHKLGCHFFIYYPWNTSNFELSIKSHPSLRQLFFYDVVLVANCHGCEGQAMKLVPYYIININYKTVRPSYLKKLQIIQTLKKLMFEVIFIFPDRILLKKVKVSSTLFCWENSFLSNLLLPRARWQEPGWDFWVRRGMTKNYSNQCLSRWIS